MDLNWPFAATHSDYETQSVPAAQIETLPPQPYVEIDYAGVPPVTVERYPPVGADPEVLSKLPRIVGLSGKKRSGKDAAAQHLVDRYGYTKLSFADPLKRGCMEFFGFSEDQVYGDLKEVVDPFWNATPRAILQFVGTDLMREQVQETIWVKRFLREVNAHPERRYVVPDLRFPNECEVISDVGGAVGRIDCNRAIREERNGRPFTPEQENHASETALDDYDEFDFRIPNAGTLEDLHHRLVEALVSGA